MIKKLLFAVFGTASFISSAQMNSAGDGLTLTNTNWQSNCYANIAPGNGGIMSHGTNIESGNDYIPANLGPYEFVSKAENSGSPGAAWFSIPVVVGDQCNNLFSEDIGIDMSSNSKVTITAKADEAGAEIEFYLGSEGQWSPTTSTWWTGTAEIKVSHTFAAADVEETFTFDFSVANPTGWSDWSGKSKIQSMGFYSKTETATFNIYEIKFGADASDDSNGDDTDDDDSDDGDDTGGDGGSNGQACATTTDDGQAEATFYTNLEDPSHPMYTGNVTCSYTRADIVGTNYGALETRTLHGSGTYPNFSDPAKYCGMCVEMTGANGTAIIQVVDECPDCWEHNSGDTDIDLSPSAFAAVVGDQSIGRDDMTWKEVSCPWTTPLHVIFQGSNYSYAKVIIGNHVNRIEKVEIGSGGVFYEMERGVDNGWVKSGFGGAWDNFIMDVRVTDIYGETVTVTGLSLENNPTNSQTDAASNFPACGLTTSTFSPNSLEYVSLYPNPANNTITFEGIEDVRLMEIVNINGQVIASKNFQTSTAQISLDISALSPGIYVAKMTGDTNTGVATFVKK